MGAHSLSQAKRAVALLTFDCGVSIAKTLTLVLALLTLPGWPIFLASLSTQDSTAQHTQIRWCALGHCPKVLLPLLKFSTAWMLLHCTHNCIACTVQVMSMPGLPALVCNNVHHACPGHED